MAIYLYSGQVHENVSQKLFDTVLLYVTPLTQLLQWLAHLVLPYHDQSHQQRPTNVVLPDEE